MARRRDEAGVAAIVLALVVAFVVVPLGAYGVDLGMQRVARRDMQSLADVVALDLARQLDGTTDAATLLTEFNGDSNSLVSQSVRRNRSTVGDHDDQEVVAQVGTTVPAKYGSDDYFTPITSGIPTAVRVTASTDVAFGLANALPDGGISKGGASRSAVATQAQPSTCFSIGTRALSLDTNASALGPFLDQILKVNLDAVDYNGIVGLRDVSVPIAGLMTQLGVGAPSQLATTNVSLQGFMLATAKALQQNGDAADATLINAVQLGEPGLPIQLSKILDIATGTSSAGLAAEANVLDLLAAAVVASNGTNSVAAHLPGVTDISITQPPQIACGAKGASAHSAQITLTLAPSLVTGLANASGLTDANAQLQVEVAPGTATIVSDLSCRPAHLDLAVTTGVVTVDDPVSPARGQVQAHVTLGAFLDHIPVLGTALESALDALGLDKVGVDIALAGSVASTSETRTVTFPPPPADEPEIVVPTNGIGSTLTLSAANVELATGQSGLVSALGDLLNGALAAVLGGVAVPLVDDTLDPVLTATLSPLLTFLGIKLGVTEVNFTKTPICAGVKLIG